MRIAVDIGRYAFLEMSTSCTAAIMATHSLRNETEKGESPNPRWPEKKAENKHALKLWKRLQNNKTEKNEKKETCYI